MTLPTFAEVLAAAPEPTDAEFFAWRAEYAKNNPPPPSETNRDALEAANRACMAASGGRMYLPEQKRLYRRTNAERKYERDLAAAWEHHVRDEYKPRWAMAAMALSN